MSNELLWHNFQLSILLWGLGGCFFGVFFLSPSRIDFALGPWREKTKKKTTRPYSTFPGCNNLHHTCMLQQSSWSQLRCRLYKGWDPILIKAGPRPPWLTKMVDFDVKIVKNDWFLTIFDIPGSDPRLKKWSDFSHFLVVRLHPLLVSWWVLTENVENRTKSGKKWHFWHFSDPVLSKW